MVRQHLGIKPFAKHKFWTYRVVFYFFPLINKKSSFVLSLFKGFHQLANIFLVSVLILLLVLCVTWEPQVTFWYGFTLLCEMRLETEQSTEHIFCYIV